MNIFFAVNELLSNFVSNIKKHNLMHYAFNCNREQGID